VVLVRSASNLLMWAVATISMMVQMGLVAIFAPVGTVVPLTVPVLLVAAEKVASRKRTSVTFGATSAKVGATTPTNARSALRETVLKRRKRGSERSPDTASRPHRSGVGRRVFFPLACLTVATLFSILSFIVSIIVIIFIVIIIVIAAVIYLVWRAVCFVVSKLFSFLSRCCGQLPLAVTLCITIVFFVVYASQFNKSEDCIDVCIASSSVLPDVAAPEPVPTDVEQFLRQERLERLVLESRYQSSIEQLERDHARAISDLQRRLELTEQRWFSRFFSNLFWWSVRGLYSVATGSMRYVFGFAWFTIKFIFLP
jgi:hypothetical protein